VTPLALGGFFNRLGTFEISPLDRRRRAGLAGRLAALKSARPAARPAAGASVKPVWTRTTIAEDPGQEENHAICSPFLKR